MLWRRGVQNYTLPGEAGSNALQNHLTTATNHMCDLKVVNENGDKMGVEQVLAIAVDNNGQVIGYVLLLNSGRQVLFPDIEDTDPIAAAHCAFCFIDEQGIHFDAIGLNQSIDFITRSRKSATITPTTVEGLQNWQFVAVPLEATRGPNLMEHSSVYPETRRNDFVDIANRVYGNNTVNALQGLGVGGDQMSKLANDLVADSYEQILTFNENLRDYS